MFSHAVAREVNPSSAIRRVILTQSKRANVGHIGSCLCVVEILEALYGRVMKAAAVDDPDRDRVVLSKGHAALALYAILASINVLSRPISTRFAEMTASLAFTRKGSCRAWSFRPARWVMV